MGVVDNTAVSETTLTLWRYATAQGQWVEVPGAVVIPESNAVVVNTPHMGLVALFRATSGSLPTVGNSADDVVALGVAQSQVTPEADASWETMEVVSRAPFLTDLGYDLRTRWRLRTENGMYG